MERELPLLPKRMMCRESPYMTEFVHGRVTHDTKPGPKPYLTREEETELNKFLVQTSDYGYGRTKREVKQIVFKTCKLKEDAEILKSQMGGFLKTKS